MGAPVRTTGPSSVEKLKLPKCKEKSLNKSHWAGYISSRFSFRVEGGQPFFIDVDWLPWTVVKFYCLPIITRFLSAVSRNCPITYS